MSICELPDDITSSSVQEFHRAIDIRCKRPSPIRTYGASADGIPAPIGWDTIAKAPGRGIPDDQGEFATYNQIVAMAIERAISNDPYLREIGSEVVPARDIPHREVVIDGYQGQLTDRAIRAGADVFVFG